MKWMLPALSGFLLSRCTGFLFVSLVLAVLGFLPMQRYSLVLGSSLWLQCVESFWGGFCCYRAGTLGIWVVVAVHLLSCHKACGIFPTRERNHVPCISCGFFSIGLPGKS